MLQPELGRLLMLASAEIQRHALANLQFYSICT
jgi:hypothetical protein